MDLPIKEHLKKVLRVKNSDEKRLDYMRLDKNEGIALFPQEFIDSLRREITPDFLTTYPEITSLQNKIARDLECETDNIYVTAGSDAGIKAAFEVFVEKGDKVLLLDPTYAMFYVYAGIFQAGLEKVNYDKNLSLTADSVIEKISRCKPKLICIANPNSPTGTVLPPEDIRKIASRALEHNSVILIDEAYYPFYPVSAFELIREYPNMIITRTFSKAMSLASARLGFVVGQKRIIESLYKVRPMYETNAFAVRFAELIMDNPKLVEKNLEEVKKSKRYLENQLDRLGLPYFKSYANFILIDVGSYEKGVQISKALNERKILVKSAFSNDNLKNCIRVSIGSLKQMECFIENLKDVLSYN